MFSDSLYDEDGEVADGDTLTFGLDAIEAPHSALPISFDPRFQDYEPLRFPDQVSPQVWEAAFGGFIEWCEARLGLEVEE